MLASLDVTTIESRPCAGCGRAHRFSVVTTPADQEPGRPVHGFFATCPDLGRRVWFVISLPDHLDGGVRVVEIGPADGDQWESNSEDRTWAAQRSRSERSEAVALGPLSNFPPRGTLSGGFRASGRAPELLRLALGCPHHA